MNSTLIGRIPFLRVGMVLFLIALLVPLVTPDFAHAALSDIACDGLQEATGENCGGGSGGALSGAIQFAINILSVIIGIAAVVMIIIGGIRFITAGGDPGSINSARNTVIYAIVGLIVVAVAQIGVRYVLTAIG